MRHRDQCHLCASARRLVRSYLVPLYVCAVSLERTSAAIPDRFIFEDQISDPGAALLQTRQTRRKRGSSHEKLKKHMLIKGVFVGDKVVSLIDYESDDGQVLHAGDHGIVVGPGLTSLKDDRHRRVNVKFPSMASVYLLPSQFTKEPHSDVTWKSLLKPQASDATSKAETNVVKSLPHDQRADLLGEPEIQTPAQPEIQPLVQPEIQAPAQPEIQPPAAQPEIQPPADIEPELDSKATGAEQELQSLQKSLLTVGAEAAEATYHRLYCEPEAETLPPLTPNTQDVQDSSLHEVVGSDGVFMISRLRDAMRFNFSMERLRVAGIYPSKFLATDGTCASEPALGKGCAKQSDDSPQWCESLHKTGSGCGNTAEQAIADSHRRALIAANERKHNWTLILEDDAVLVRPNRWNQAFRRAWQKVPPETKIVRFSWCMPGNESVIQQPTYADAGDFRLIQWTGYANGYRAGGCTSGYMVHRDIIPQMVGLFPCCCAVDCCFENDLYNRVVEGTTDTKGMTIMMSMDSWGSNEYIVDVGNAFNHWGPQYGVMFQALGDLASTRLTQLEAEAAR